MESDVCNRSSPTVRCPGKIAVVGLVDLDVGIVCFGKSLDLDIVTIFTVARHSIQIVLPRSVDLGGCWPLLDRRCRNILPLGVSAMPTAGWNVDEGLERIGILSHIFNDPRANLLGSAHISEDLVRQRAEEAVSWT